MTERAIRIEKIRVEDVRPGDVIRFDLSSAAATKRQSTWARVETVAAIPRNDRIAVTTNYHGRTSLRPLDLIEVQIKQGESRAPEREPEPRVPDGGYDVQSADPVYRETMIDAGRGHLL